MSATPDAIRELALAITGPPDAMRPDWLEFIPAVGDYVSHYQCRYRHCSAKIYGHARNCKDAQHSEGCPVLVAQDILTGDWWKDLVTP